MATVRLPPGPPAHFLTGHLPEFRRDMLGFLAQSASQYGDVVSLRLATVPAYLLNHPDHIEYVLVHHNQNFKKHQVWRHLRGLFGNGMLVSEGDFWLRQRRMAQPAFHRQRIAAYGEVMVAYAESLLASWRDGERRDIHQDMMRLTLKITAKSLFGVEVADETNVVDSALQVIMEEFSSRLLSLVHLPDSLPTPGNLRFRRAIRQLDEIIYSIIRQRRLSGEDTGDLLSMLLQAQDEDGSRMTDQQVRDEAVTLFLAGHETTALALSWTWYLLAQHPEVEARLATELESVLGREPRRAPGVADLPRLRYAESVILESMRLYPPAYLFGREALRDCEIGGFPVPAGQMLFISQWVMHRDPRFFERPNEFDPARWLGDLSKRLPKYAYFPFSGGPRVCIGNSFALMEAVLLLAAIARQFRMALVPEHPVVPWPSVTLRPKHGIQVIVSRRS